MAFKIIHLEDSAMKHSTISRAIKSVVSAEIDWGYGCVWFNETLFRETYHSVTSRFFSNNTCWKLIFAIHFISPTRLNKILFFYCIIMHYPV